MSSAFAKSTLQLIAKFNDGQISTSELKSGLTAHHWRESRHVATTPSTIIAKINEEAQNWIMAGATKLTEIIPSSE
uniref:Uncharacterized protein n=1 Tax=Oryza rufipogon TaxID=4529 RepID=A0A0E0QD30_ORYRU